MAAIAKTVVATGATSGLGFELVKQLLEQTQPYKFILGARNPATAQAAFDGLKYDSNKHSLTIFPLELSNLKTVKTFSQQTLEKLGQDKIDYLMLNAAISNNADAPGPYGSKWSEAYIVNHLSQHYLIHLLREKLEASQSRIVVVSSGAVRNVEDPSLLDNDVKGGSKTERSVYSATKFIQLLGAHWWRRQLQGKCHVVAVSPGLIPGTGLPRGFANTFTMPLNHPDAKSVPEGAQSIYRAFTRDDFPEDPDQIFLTSWGEWWPKDVYKLSLDKSLQDKWSPSKEEIEKEEGVNA
ncbi:NAD(P)-binding protein [Hypomontagnella submonticulosa]|nr:NAD(P)-binding protein [Hypomontagnella submonticulosa]